MQPRNDRAFTGKVSRGKAGMAGLALTTVAGLTPPEWHVTLHDARAAPVDYDQDVGLVGLTALTADVTSAYGIADRFRGKGVPVVMGGIHASALPGEALEHVDAVVVGEAEGVWETLLRDLEAGKLERTYRAEKRCDMQGMKIPRRDLLDRRMYVSGFYTLQATRGCPFDCAYCAVTGVFGREFRTRPVAEVIDEIRGFEGREFFFVDDNICGKADYAKELFRELAPLGKTWGGQACVTFARDDELLELYARSGGRYVFIGFETTSAESLAGLNKQWNRPENYGEAIRRIHGAGINILGSFIFGLEEDDASAFARTLDFITEHNVDAAQFHILTPFPGTRMYDELEAQGRIPERDWAKYHTGEVVFEPKGMTAGELADGFYRIYRETYSIGRMLRRIFRSCRGIPYRLAVNWGQRKRALRMPKA